MQDVSSDAVTSDGSQDSITSCQFSADDIGDPIAADYDECLGYLGDPPPPPVATQTCISYVWVLTGWESCSDGIQTQPFGCQSNDGGTIATVDDADCIDEGPKPDPITQSCSVSDTGQTDCYNSVGIIVCPSPGEAYYGQDANYTISPPSYTKLDENGEETVSDWIMVKDNVTGLIWEVKTDDGTIHHQEDKYIFDDAQSVFIADLNINTFGGYDNWRMPTLNELVSIVDYGTDAPNINAEYFSNTMSWYYWSSITVPGTFDNMAWSLDFRYGIRGIIWRTEALHVRAVSGENPTQDFTDNGDGTITDNNSGLMWAQDTADTDGDGDVDEDGDDEINWQGALA